MDKISKKDQLIADLQQQLIAARAQQTHNYHFASYALDKMTTKRFMGSGLIITIKALNGEELIKPVCIKDGLSDATIAALQADLARSYALAVAFKPRGADDIDVTQLYK